MNSSWPFIIISIASFLLVVLQNARRAQAQRAHMCPPPRRRRTARLLLLQRRRSSLSSARHYRAHPYPHRATTTSKKERAHHHHRAYRAHTVSNFKRAGLCRRRRAGLFCCLARAHAQTRARLCERARPPLPTCASAFALRFCSRSHFVSKSFIY